MLTDVRRVRTWLNETMRAEGSGYAVITIIGGEFGVFIKFRQGTQIPESVKRAAEFDGVPIRVGRVPIQRPRR